MHAGDLSPFSAGSNWKAYHSRRRQDSHEQAKLAADAESFPPVMDHPLVAQNDPEVVIDSAALVQVIDQLRETGQFGYDSEFIGELSYFPKSCVIQVATFDRVILIDALAGLDLKPFWELLADPKVEKIVHCGIQDLEPVVRHLGRPPSAVHDTQLAATFLGWPYPSGLGRLVESLLDGDLGPESKFSQWDHRPLTPTQVQYAANDVRYLPLLLRIINERLEPTANAPWAKEECQSLCELATYQFDVVSQRQRMRQVELLNGIQVAVLDALLLWRDQTAQELDVPPRTFVKDRMLFLLAKRQVKSPSQLREIVGLPRRVKRVYGESIFELVNKELGRVDSESDHALDPYSYKSRIVKVWAAVKQRCQDRLIDPALVTNKREVAQYVREVAAGHAPSSTRLTRGWRRELLESVLP